MPVSFSIQPVIDAQTTALTTAINAARDNVKADNATQITNQNTSLTTAINAARDNVKADNVAQVAAQTTAINGNTDTKTAALTTAVNAKGVVKSIQRLTANTSGLTLNLTIAAVDSTKAVIVLGSNSAIEGGSVSAVNKSVSAQITTATNVQVTGNSGFAAAIQVVEYF